LKEFKDIDSRIVNVGEELKQALFKNEHADERKKYMQFLVDYIFSHPEGVFYSCNSGSIWDATEKAGFPVSRCMEYIIEYNGIEKIFMKLDLIEPVRLEKTETNARSRFYKPKVSLEAAKEALKDFIL
jgi:hypothetical protein